MYYVLLILFGVLGALARYALESLIHTSSFPLATLIINIVGCFLLAFVIQFLIWLPWLSSRMVSAIGTGFVGSFTTFSTFALESSQLIQKNLPIAIGYILASLIGGLLACLLGYWTSKTLLIHKRRWLRNAD
ncbi:fluoride efflux transporter FluC [Sporolactobacillus pectinivorans]|uniref:fluoride efflux transporter FluC n=1 Tax=Sporolactobacillus pectinivorans TaxID=1591408 RepID=UPI000C2695D3|nr:CrcB family protein [Sporolactobacillus pectinivorans]